MRKTSATQEIVSFGELYERMTDVVTGNVEHRYHVHNDERIVSLVRRSTAQGTRTLHVHADHLGSIDVLTDGVTGTVTERRSYDAFGAPRHPDWGSGQPPSLHELSSLGFTGHEADLDIGLVNMKGRIYDPKLGRFLTPDPLVPRPLFGQSWNGYSYVRNSPLSLVDPSGFQEQPPATEEGCSQGCTIWVFGPPREPKPPAPPKVVEGNLEEAAGVGSTQAPGDVGTSGVRSGWSPQLPATLQALARGDAIARRIMDGVHLGMARMLLESAKLGILGGTSRIYVAYTTITAAWNGYKESGLPGALDAVNPASQMVEAGVEAYEAAAAEDWEAAGASLFKAGSIGMSILATAVGVGGAITATVGSTAKAAGSAVKPGPQATVPYKRPSGATTPAQRASVQGKPCVDCGAVTSKQVADHKTPLVKEHYETGSIAPERMRSIDAVQPQCPTCSARQGAELSRYAREQKVRLGQGNP
ncbi:RHS repeat domain-containing protein [Chondromyces crocatus]|uniref:Teneurin-like YD-shell domain-containing protein n=1 Tax=Chondromyces crocatus TaxID=52 RepID=A0A0K1EJM2_CHOCO|nr:RHS repeat-associated core domain-containing protein [Chondromyces crocatus]AKT40798.1 uncharacterized protein CMC5_049540 [Chondromyces crocatus]